MRNARLLMYLPAVCLTWFTASPAGATTVVALDHRAHAAQSDLIVLAEVLGSEHFTGVDGQPYTDTTLRVSRSLKGIAPTTVTVRQLGGPTKLGFLRVVGDAKLSVGEEVLVFLADRVPAQNTYALTAMAQSKFSVIGTGSDGHPLLQRRTSRLQYLLPQGGTAPSDDPLSLAEIVDAISNPAVPSPVTTSVVVPHPR